jgi:arginyl-tRNA synthetase
MKFAGDKFSSHVLSHEEKFLIKLIYQYPAIIKASADAYNPAVVAGFAYDLAKAYNHFYHEHIVVDAEQKEITSFRLHLSEMTSTVIAKCMEMLGIRVPERM